MINRDTFFSAFRNSFGSLSQSQVDGLTFLLNSFENDSRWTDIRNVAYALATIIRETAHTFQPIQELGSGAYLSKYWTNPRLRVMLGNIEPDDAQNYKGRGYVQITGRANYKKFGIENTPEKALEPQTAFDIMSQGMFEGIFTGKALGTYVNDDETDYVNARRVINGTDHAVEIAHDATSLEAILMQATQGD